MSSATYDVVVVGVGGMGSAAAFHLARRGMSVLALEQFAPGHDRGSSHGLSRIIRLAYFEDPSYVPLLRRAFQLWRELELESPGRLLHVTGAIDAGPPGSRNVAGSLLSCAIHDLPHQVLDADGVRERFPAYRLPAGFTAVFQPDGGYLVPEACIDAHVRQAMAHGARIHGGQRVTSWHSSGSGVVVTTSSGTVHAGQLVLAGGAWMPKQSQSLTGLLRPERQVVGWFEVSDHRAFTPERFPVFVMNTRHGDFYGFPESGETGFKIGKYHHRGEIVDPDSMVREVTDEDVAVLRECLAECFPAANGALLRSSTCIFTNTPDEHFIIDRLPENPDVLAVSACSGHGFKFCSVIGEIVADLVATGATSHDISLFRLDRF